MPAATLALLLLSGCWWLQPPAVPEIVLFPAQGSPLFTYQFRVLAGDPDGDSVLIRLAWGDGDTTAWSDPVCCGCTLEFLHSYAIPGTYLLSAQARDETGRSSDWSVPVSTTMAQGGNAPPVAQFAPDGPERAAITECCTLSCRAFDPEAGSMALRFSWGDGDTSGWSRWQSGDSLFRATHRYSRPGTYSVCTQARDWPGARSVWSPSHPVTVHAGALPGEVKWRVPLMIRGWSSPALSADGVLYVGEGDGLHAISTAGAKIWRFTSQRWLGTTPAVGTDGTIYFWTRDSLFLALRPDGQEKWRRFFPGWDYMIGPALGVDGTIYAGSTDGSLQAFNPDGELKWRFQTGGRIISSPAIGTQGLVYFASDDESIYGVRPDGSRECSYGPVEWSPSSPAIGSDGAVYIGSQDGWLYALNPDLTLRWRFSIGNIIWSSPVIGPDGTLFAGSCDGNLYALDPDGNPRWSHQVPHRLVSSPALAADGSIYIISVDDVRALNPDGSLKWRLETGEVWFSGSSPVIGPDGTLYAGNDYWLYAIVGSAPPADSPWPMYRHDPLRTGRADLP